MKKTTLLVALAAASLGAIPQDSDAVMVVQYGPSDAYVTNNLNFQSGSGSGNSTYTFSRTYDTSTAWLASGSNYSGPTLYGGYYQTLTAGVTFSPTAALGQLRNNETTAGTNDVIRFQSMYATASNITSATQNFAVAFATGGNYSMDSTSALNWNARSAAAPLGSASMRFLLVAGGTTYLSSSNFVWSNVLTNYSLTNPAIINWAAWTPSATMDFSGLSFNTPGSSLSNIAFAGFAINQSVGSGQNLATLDTQVFTADLVPEPTTYALLGLGGLAVLACRLRRNRRS